MLNDNPAVGVDVVDSNESGVEELNRLFEEGLTCDRAHFAEQRTNILLYKGDHFKRRAQTFLDRNRDNVTPDTKLKLSENHTQVVCNRLISSLTNQAPGCLFVPNNDNELADIKDAELSNSVKEHAENELNYDEIVDRLATNLVVTGEMFQFYYFDPYDGDVVGYEQKVNHVGDPLYNHPQFGEINEPQDLLGEPLEMAQDKTKPVFRGKLKLKAWHPYNVVRHKNADNINESPFLCLQEMISQSEALKLIKGVAKDEYDEFKAEITTASDTSFKIFDATMGDYADSKGQVVIKYWFFRRCYKYPNGKYKVQIGNKVLSEDELPFGIWPVEYTGFRTITGSARASSVIKDIRPAQTHLNFLISNSAFHMIALGDDKIVTQMGANVQMGPTWNGVRTYKVNGPPATVIPGRDAGQFEKAIERAVNTIYRLADDQYQLEETKIQDPKALLFAKLSHQQKHSPLARKFERSLCNGWKIYMQLAKHYFDDDQIIKCTGKREAINIKEFKAMRPDGVIVKAKPVSGTLTDQLGVSMEAEVVLQYVGKELPKSVLARVINQLPYLSKESIAGDMLLTDKNITNDILALDRGEWIDAQQDDEHDEYIPRLKSRMKQADFRLMSEQIKQMYQKRYQQHVEFKAMNEQALLEAEAGFIPMDGGLVKVSIWDESTQKNMLLPMTSLLWLKDKIEKQGVDQKVLSQMDDVTQADILTKATAMSRQNQPAMAPPSPSPIPA